MSITRVLGRLRSQRQHREAMRVDGQNRIREIKLKVVRLIEKDRTLCTVYSAGVPGERSQRQAKI
jgi:hypothetical protein